MPPLGYLPLAVLSICFTLACLECCVGLGGVAVQPLLSDLPLAVLSACFALACVDCCCSGCFAWVEWLFRLYAVAIVFVLQCMAILAVSQCRRDGHRCFELGK